MFKAYYSDSERLQVFQEACAGLTSKNFDILVAKFDFSECARLVDIGGGNANLSLAVAAANAGITCVNWDLPPVTEYAAGKIAQAGMGDRVTAEAGNFLTDAFPGADVITMSLIIHEWSLETKIQLIQKAYDALLSESGVLINIENMIDAERRTNLDAMLWS